MTFDQFIEKIANRAGELAVKSKTYLILSHPQNTEGTKSGAQWHGTTKEQLISAIIFEEFGAGGEQCPFMGDFDLDDIGRG